MLCVSVIGFLQLFVRGGDRGGHPGPAGPPGPVPREWDSGPGGQAGLHGAAGRRERLLPAQGDPEGARQPADGADSAGVWEHSILVILRVLF